MPEFPMDPLTVADAIGISLDKWEGDCDGIARAVLERLPIEGARLARGHWFGTAPMTGAFKGRKVSQHSWIVLADKRVLDPTRFAFEDRKPYIYVGRSDNYSEAGDEFRAHRPRPAPAGKVFNVTPPQAEVLRTILPVQTTTTMHELAWVANRPVSELGANARAIYHVLKELGLKTFVPMDNWMRIMEIEKLKAKRGDQGWYTLNKKRKST